MKLEAYFPLLEQKIASDSHSYESLGVKYPNSTVVLFDKESGEALAAVTFLPRAIGGRAQTLLVARPNHVVAAGAADVNFMQGMCNVDNDEVKFVLTNLTNEAPLAMEIKKVSASGEVNDLHINKIDVITESSCIEVESDQGEDDKTLVLRGIVDKKSGSAKEVSVAQDEAKSAQAQQMSRFQVRVEAPKRCDDMCKKVANGEWRCVDVVVRRAETLVAKGPRPFTFGVDSSYNYRAVGQLPFARGNSANASRGSGGGFTFSAAACGFSSEDVRGHESDDHELAALDEEQPAKKTKISAEQVASSQAAQIVRGSQSVNVNAEMCDETFDSARPSKRLMLALSVWRDMSPLAEPLSRDEALQIAETQIKSFTEKANKELVAQLKKVYESDECAVCMEATPTQIFIRCGHQCVCKSCLTADGGTATPKCYLCRGRVVAVVEAGGVLA